MNILLNLIRKNKIFLFISFIYLISILIVSPWGNYGLGDDIYYLIQIKAFQSGDFVKNAYIDTSVVLQIFLGLFWGSIFGINLLSLRILTIIFTLIVIYLLLKILRELKVSEALSSIVVLILIFNSKFYYLSLTFNTEIYFTCFILAAALFLLKYNNSNKHKFLILASLYGGLSVSIRQVGFLLLIPILIQIYLLNKKKIFKFKFLFPILLFFMLSFIGIFWPKHTSPIHANSQATLNVIDLQNISTKFINIWMEIPYLSLLLVPFLFVFYKNLNVKTKIATFFIGVTIGYFIYQVNIFGIGNILYIEGIGARSYTKIREHLFNNLAFKFFISMTFGITISSFILFLATNLKKIKLDNALKLLITLSVVFLASTLLAGVSYDRYFIYFEIFILIFLVYFFTNIHVSLQKSVYILLGIYLLISIFCSLDIHSDTKLKWQTADNISSSFNIPKQQIFVQDNYLKLNYILDKNDLSGMGPLKPELVDYKCYILNGIEERNSFLRNFLSFISRAFDNRYFGVKKIEGFGYHAGQMTLCEYCKIESKQFYFSPIYEVLGISKYVKAYCIK